MPRSKRVDGKADAGALNPLRFLPIHIRQKPGRKMYVDSKNGNVYTYNQALIIAEANAPKPSHDHAAILEKRWDLRMDTHEINEDGVYVRTAQRI